jgi:hypothetical protein
MYKPKLQKTPSHTAEIFTDGNTLIKFKFHYKAGHAPAAPLFTDEDVDEELEILEAYQETKEDTFALDENDPKLEKLLNDNVHLWDEIEEEDWYHQRT